MPDLSLTARQLRAALATALLALTLGAYASVVGAEFLQYDDALYVTANPALASGLSAEGVSWAFTTYYTGNWHPITWLSLLADYELFGLEPAGYHAMNLALHALTTLLLFLWLDYATGAPARSAFVAGIFALHPMHVESVAWVAERKDVLAGVFFVLCLWTYVWAIRARSPWRMGLVAAVFALGLMSKPMLITLPLILLLLDDWPLGRLRVDHELDRARVRQALLEKLPLFALCAASAFFTLQAQAQSGWLAPLSFLPGPERIGNALVAYSLYVSKALWPVGLIPFYPQIPGGFGLGSILASLAGLAVVTFAALRSWRSAPYFGVGWFWFGIMLLPVVGIVQVGGQMMADRYTYLPFIGLSLVLAWGAPALVGEWRYRTPVLAAAGTAILIACAVATGFQARLWQNSETLFTHTVAVSPDNPIAHQQLAIAHMEAGRIDEAEAHFTKVTEIVPQWWNGQLGLANALLRQGKADQAQLHLDRALAADPTLGGSHSRAVNTILRLARLGQSDAAITHLAALVQADPSFLSDTGALAQVLGDDGPLGTHARAVVEVQLERHPQLLGARFALAEALYQQGQTHAAVRHYRIALEQKRDMILLNNLAWILATDPDPSVRDPAEAVSLAEEAVRQTRDPEPNLLDTLATAYEQAGRGEDASATRRTAARASARRARQLPGS